MKNLPHLLCIDDDNKIKGIYAFYDRNELSKMYDEEDPLETVE